MTFDQQHVPPAKSDARADGLGEDYVKSANQVDREAAWTAIKEFADHGKGNASSLPELFHRAAWPDGAKSVMGAIAKRTTSEIVFACVRESRMAVGDALKFVLVDAKSSSNPAQLKADLELYLRSLSAWELSQLEQQPEVIDKLKDKIFKGVALWDLSPELATIPAIIHDKPRLLGWLVASTNPTLLGRRLTMLSDADIAVIAPTLDAIGGWAWLDSFHLSPTDANGYGVVTMRDKAGDPTAKGKLAKLAATFTEDMDKRAAEAKLARDKMDEQLHKKDDAALLDAAARTQQTHQGDKADVKSRLANANPDMVFEFLVATDQDVKLGIQLLDGAKDIADDKKTKLSAGQHIREFLRTKTTSDVVTALADDTTRKLVRKHIGRDASLLGLFTINERLEVHSSVVKNAALRQWLYEDGHPESMLWLAAGGPEAREGSRMVRSERGNAWVKKLPPGADETQLRRFLLASNDPAAVKHVREMLNDQPMEVAKPETKPLGDDPAAFGLDARKDFDTATAPVEADSSTAVARLADLTDGERAAVLKDPLALKRLFDDVFGDDLVRAVYLLNPTIMQLLAFPLPAGRTFDNLFTYIAMRPDVEAVMAAKSKASIEAARRLLTKASPFDLFPVLRTNAKALANVLMDNKPLFEWILDDTEPNTALRILAQPEVRATAALHLQGRKTMLHDLPDFEKLTEDGQRHYKIVAEKLTSKKAVETSKDYVNDDHSGDHDANRNALDLRHAREKKSLVEGIRQLGERPDKGALLALVRGAKPNELTALLGGAHPDEVKILRTWLDMGPQHVFPEISPVHLFALKGARDWLLATEAPTTILALLAHAPKAAKKSVGEFLDANPDWLDRCPRGGALSPIERQVIDDIAESFHTLASYEKAFAVRFDVEVTGLDYGYTQKLWALCKRLPPSQFNQNAVRKVAAANIGPVGQWSKPDIELSSDLTRFEGQNDTGYDEGQLLTLDEVKRLYQLSEKDIEQASWIEKDQGKYRVKPVGIEQFKSTVLHEIGHSIDTMLGERTDLVFGIGGWKTFGVDQFDDWAREMDGFKDIAPADKPKVSEAWKQALRANKSVAEMVDAEHPARKGPSTSPLVDAATRGSTFRYTEPDKHVYSDRVCFRNGGQLFSTTKDAYLTAPSRYSLHGSGEYFAESYVEYYRDYDGTPATEGKKGGQLASWIKEWMTVHVDQIRLNPQRGKPPKTPP